LVCVHFSIDPFSPLFFWFLDPEQSCFDLRALFSKRSDAEALAFGIDLPSFPLIRILNPLFFDPSFCRRNTLLWSLTPRDLIAVLAVGSLGFPPCRNHVPFFWLWTLLRLFFGGFSMVGSTRLLTIFFFFYFADTFCHSRILPKNSMDSHLRYLKLSPRVTACLPVLRGPSAVRHSQRNHRPPRVCANAQAISFRSVFRSGPK